MQEESKNTIGGGVGPGRVSWDVGEDLLMEFTPQEAHGGLHSVLNQAHQEAGAAAEEKGVLLATLKLALDKVRLELGVGFDLSGRLDSIAERSLRET